MFKWSLHLFITQSSHLSFAIGIMPFLWAVILSIYDAVSTIPGFLSKPLSVYIVSRVVASLAMHFSSYWDVGTISSGILSLKSFLFPPLISHSSPPAPPLWNSDPAAFTDACSVCFSTQEQPSLSSLFLASFTSLAPAYALSNSQGLSLLQPKIHRLYVSHFFPKDLSILLP